MRKALRALRHPGSGVPEDTGPGLTKFSIWWRFKMLTKTTFEEWMGSDLSGLALVAIQMDGLYLTSDVVMVGAVGNDVAAW